MTDELASTPEGQTHPTPEGQARKVRSALVTGATGGIGRRLVKRLLDEGVKVRVLARNAAKATSLGDVNIIVGDISDARRAQEAVEGMDTVFHLAAWMNKPFSRAAAEAANVTGTEYLLHAARRAGVERFVHVSTVAVYGPVSSGDIDEDAPYWKVDDLYSDTKAEGEARALAFARETGFPVVVVRPAMVYGPGIEPWTLLPVKSIKSGSPLIIGDGNAFVNPVYVDTVVDALWLAATCEGVNGEAFNISDGVGVTWNEFFGYYGRMVGKSVRKVPQALAENGAALAGAVAKLIGQPPRATREMVGVMTGRPVFTIDKAKARLGFEPRINLEEGMRRTEQWLRENGLLKGTLAVPGSAGAEKPVAVVTGAASGMGRATAERLQRAGYHVVAADVDDDGLAGLADQGIETLHLDVTNDASIASALERLRALGRVDALCNIAGLASPGPLENQPYEAIDRQFQVNTFGPLKLARAIAPLMRARGAGRIVNVSSTNGKVVSPFMGAYSASKFALEALSDALRLELAPFGVSVVIVQPGSVKTPFADRAKAQLDKTKETAGDYLPYLEAFEHSAMWGQGMTAPEKIAAVIEGVLKSPNPAPRVAATLDAVPAMMMARLPDRARDLLFSTLSGLKSKPKA